MGSRAGHRVGEASIDSREGTRRQEGEADCWLGQRGREAVRARRDGEQSRCRAGRYQWMGGRRPGGVRTVCTAPSGITVYAVRMGGVGGMSAAVVAEVR
jgi:hypothetical protein